MAIKKSELYSSLWASCDELRGGMDPSQYKDYILVLLFVNLMNNAMKFVAPGVLPRVMLSAKVCESLITIEFKDNGIGMKKEYLSQIFMPFKRLHGMGVYEGTGIGLSICRKIVERHGGQIWAESELGKGSCFYVSIKRP